MQVWDLKKAGQLFDQHGSNMRTDSLKYSNRARFCTVSAVKAWNLLMFLVAKQKCCKVTIFKVTFRSF